MAGPGGELDWHTQQWNNEMGEYAFQQLSRADTILFGRVTYEAMANFWPVAFKESNSKKGDIEFANMMNSYKKIVFSKTLSTVEWKNSRLVKENVEQEIMQLKHEGGKDLIIWGGVGLVSSFMQMSLIDEYRISIAPVVLGNGMKPLINALEKTELKLLDMTTFSNGVVLLCYHRA